MAGHTSRGTGIFQTQAGSRRAGTGEPLAGGATGATQPFDIAQFIMALAGIGAAGQTTDPAAGGRRQQALGQAGQLFRAPSGGESRILQAGGVTQQLFAPEAGSRIGGSRTLSITGGFAPGSFGANVQEMLLRALSGGGQAGGGGGIGLPTRESLLGPRQADINDVIEAAMRRTSNRFAGLGRDVTGTVPTQALGELEERRTREVSRAGGEIDTLLAQLGLQSQAFQEQSRQNELSQLISLFSRL